MYASRGRAATAATRLLDGDNLHARGRVPIQVGHRSVNVLEKKVYTRSSASDAGGELNMTMPPRPRSCADRPPTSLLGACGSAVAAGGMSAQRGAVGAWVRVRHSHRRSLCAPGAAAALWCRVARACSARVVDGYVVGADR